MRMPEPDQHNVNMTGGKQIVYVYDGDSNSKDVEVDIEGKTDIPKEGRIIPRKGMQWKVVQVQIQQANDGSLSVVTIYLQSA